MLSNRHLAATVGLFVFVGIGLGLSGFMALDTVQQGFVEGTQQGSFARGIGQALLGIVALQSAFIVFMLGSLVAAIAAVANSGSYSTRKALVVNNSVAALVGFPIMVVIAIVIMVLALGGMGGSGGGGGSTIDLAQIAKLMIIITIPTVAVAAGSGFTAFELNREPS